MSEWLMCLLAGLGGGSLGLGIIVVLELIRARRARNRFLKMYGVGLRTSRFM